MLDDMGHDVSFDVGYSLMSQCVEKQLRNAQYVVLAGDKLVLDAVQPVTDNLARVRAYIEGDDT